MNWGLSFVFNNQIAIIIILLIQDIHSKQSLLFFYPRRLWSFLCQHFGLSLLEKFFLKRNLSLMIQPVVDRFLAFLTFRLRVQQLRMRGHMSINEFLGNLLLSQLLALLECCLISQELFFSSSLFSFLFIDNRLKVPLFLLRFSFENAHLFNFTDAFALPSGESLHVFHRCGFRHKFFLKQVQ